MHHFWIPGEERLRRHRTQEGRDYNFHPLSPLGSSAPFPHQTVEEQEAALGLQLSL